MTTGLHVMLSPFSRHIVAGRMRRDTQGRLIATSDVTDVTQEAIHAVVYRYYAEARETPEGAVAYEYMLNNGQKVLLKCSIVKGAEE